MNKSNCNRFTTHTKEVNLTGVQKLKHTTDKPLVQSAGCSAMLHAEVVRPIAQLVQPSDKSWKCNVFPIVHDIV